MAVAIMLAACGGGGGGDAPAAAAESCRTVTDKTGDVLDASGKVIMAGSSRTYSLCCANGFKVTNTADVTGPTGTTKGSTVNSCAG